MGKGGGSCISSNADEPRKKANHPQSGAITGAEQPAPVAASTQQAPVAKMGETNIAIIICERKARESLAAAGAMRQPHLDQHLAQCTRPRESSCPLSLAQGFRTMLHECEN